MPESISRLMDGEVDDTEVEIVCAELRRPDAVATWVCYHVIGDTLRGGAVPIPQGSPTGSRHVLRPSRP